MIFRMKKFPRIWATMPAAMIFRPMGSVIMRVEITGRHEHQSAQRCDRQQRQNRGGEPAVGADRFDLAFQPESFADDVRKAVQNFAQIAARLALQQHSGRKEPHIGKRHALAEVRERAFERRAQILLIEQRAEFLAQRLVNLLAHHFEADGEGVAGAHGTRQEIERVGQLRFQRVDPLADRFFDTYKSGRKPAHSPDHERAQGHAGDATGMHVLPSAPMTNVTPIVISRRVRVQSRPDSLRSVAMRSVTFSDPSRLSSPLFLSPVVDRAD